jgi:2-polyprenyl-3-methyl-5-hydroxy-6-metoxy-1,4-benzoquinol methylase
MHDASNIPRIIAVYDSAIIRLYVRIRFHILRQRFLHEIGQYLPARGRILDVGCGFGLFSLFYAMLRPQATLHGIDLNPRRIAHAQRAALKLGLTNATYRTGSAVDLQLLDSYDAVYMLDIVHHIPREAVQPLIRSVHSALPSGGVLLIKDIDCRPAYKRWFTWWLDKLMDPKTPVHYWPSEELIALLHACGFDVSMHHMVDYLPYPHILYICRKR